MPALLRVIFLLRSQELGKKWITTVLVRISSFSPWIDPADAVRAASQTPADLLGRPDLGRIQAGARADLVVLGDDRTVERVIRGGVDL